MNPGVLDEGGLTPLPENPYVDSQLVEREKQMAKYLKTPEWEKLVEHFNERIEFYQQYLPDGKPLTDVPVEERGYMWVAANAIINELRGVIALYEQAGESVKDAERRG